MSHKHYYRNPVRAALARRKKVLHTVALLGTPLLFLAVVLTGNFLAPHSYAASYTWDGGGATNNWSDCANWSTNVCPVAADSVTFNATSTKDSTIDASWGGTLAGLTVASGYTGTISMARSLTMSGAYSQATGTFTADANNLTVGGGFTLSGGTFTASSATTQVNGAFTVSGSPTFNANGGTFAFGGAGNATLSCNNVSFNLVQFVHTANMRTVNSNCSFPLGNNPSMFAVTLAGGTLTGTGTLTSTNAFRLNAGATLTGFTGLNTQSSTFIIDGASMDFGDYTTFDINSEFNILSGSFTAPSGTATFARHFTIGAGVTFNANGGTIIFDGSINANITCNNAVFNFVRFTTSGETRTIASSCNLPLGNNPSIPPAMTLNGTLSGMGTLTTNILNLNTGYALSGFSGLITNSILTVNATSADFSSFTTFDANSSFILNSGAAFTAPSVTASFAGTFTINSGATFNANGGTVVFDGGTATIVSCNNTAFNLVAFTHSSASTKTIASNCSFPLGSNPSISGKITLNGTLSGADRLTFASGSASTFGVGAVLSGFDGLEFANTLIITGVTMDFSAYTTFDINGAFTLSSGAVFTAPTGTSNFGSTFTLNSGTTFNANGSTVVFDGVGATLSCNNTSFNLVAFAHVSGTKTISSDCNLPLGNDPIITAGIVLNGTLTGTGTARLGTTTVNAPGAILGFNGMRAGIVSFNGGTVDMGDFVVAEFTTLQLQNVDFTAPSYELGVRVGLHIRGTSVFDPNNGTVVMRGVLVADDSATSTIECNGSTSFSLVKFEENIRMVVSAGCVIPVGHNPVIASEAIRLNTGTRREFRLAGKLVGSGTMTVYGVLTPYAGYQLEGFSNIITDSVLVNNSTTDLSGLDSLSILFDLTVPNGSFTPPPVMSVGGNINRTGGAFSANGGSVLLTGTDQTLTGDIEFHNLTKTTSGTVTVGAGNTVTTTGLLKLSRPSLVSSAPGVSWNINMQGTTNICYVSVTDSNSIGNAVVAYQSTSNSANPGWVFLNAACPGSGGGGGGTGGEPTSTVTNYTQAQAAATAATLTTPTTTLPPYHGLPSTLAKTVDTIPGSREALRAFLRFVGVTALVMLLAGSIFWFVATKRKHDQDEDTFDVSHWQGTRVG